MPLPSRNRFVTRRAFLPGRPGFEDDDDAVITITMANLNVLGQVQGQVADVVSPAGWQRPATTSCPLSCVQADAEALQRVESARTQGHGLIENAPTRAATREALAEQTARSGQQKSGYRSEAWHSFWYVHLPREAAGGGPTDRATASPGASLFCRVNTSHPLRNADAVRELRVISS